MIVPARNEAASVAGVVSAIGPDLLPEARGVLVLVVDDGSTDGTAEAARAAGALVVRHRLNLGKGAALRTGCEAALGRDAAVIAVIDADGQHRPADLAAVLEPVLRGDADVALAYRTFTREMPAPMRLGNWGLSTAFAMLYGKRFRDTQCGLRAFTADAYRTLAWESAGYAVETEMLVHATRSHLRVTEVPIATVYHDRYKGTTPSDGVRILVDMLRWVLDRR